MDIEKLGRDDFADSSYREPTIRFTWRGMVYLNRAAVVHLHLSSGGVEICYDKDSPADFSITRSDSGWVLRKSTAGAVAFNSVGLSRHVIDKTWERCSHVVGAVKPLSLSFRIARLPLDDGKNKDVFALLRKKE
jgi:hypothetical protein